MEGRPSNPSILLDRHLPADAAPKLRPFRQQAQQGRATANGPGLLGRRITWRERVGVAELRRRAWHMSPGLLPFPLWFFPHQDPISLTLRLIMSATIVGLALRIYLQYRMIQRHGERRTQRMGAVLGYACSVLFTLLLLPAHAEIGLAVLGILAFGDGAATLGGLLLGGRRLPWNPRKSWSGLASFCVVGTLMTALIYWGESHNPEAQTPGMDFTTAVLCAGIATAVSAVAESWNSRIDDNIRVGIAAVISMVGVHAWFLGF